MMTIAGVLRRSMLGLSPNEASFARRGFPLVPDGARVRLERAGRAFVHGYNAAVELGHPPALDACIAELPRGLRGFAFEGAAMGLELLDLLTPWRRNRVTTFLHGDGAPHVYMVHVGAGWAVARLRRSITPIMARFDPLLRWLLLDGYGFHEGYFSPHRWIDRLEVPAFDEPYQARAFDQGLGRSLWFYACADSARVRAALDRFPAHRRSDVWSGIGLACAYAGGATPQAIESLLAGARSHWPHLAQGAAFAAKTRERAGNEAAHTELACQILCGMPARDAARVTDDALGNLSAGACEPAYESWRRRIAAHFAASVHTRLANGARSAR